MCVFQYGWGKEYLKLQSIDQNVIFSMLMHMLNESNTTMALPSRSTTQ